MRPWIWKLCVTDQYLRRMNLLGIWQIQNVEQVRPVSIPTLSAPETFNFFFKNMNYCTKLKNCMRPWIWKLCVTDQYLRRMNLLGIWQIQNVEQVRPVSIPNLQFLFQKHDLLQKVEHLHAGRGLGGSVFRMFTPQKSNLW